MEKQNWLFQYAAIGQNPSQTTKLSSKSQLGPLKIEEITVQWVGLFFRHPTVFQLTTKNEIQSNTSHSK